MTARATAAPPASNALNCESFLALPSSDVSVSLPLMSFAVAQLLFSKINSTRPSPFNVNPQTRQVSNVTVTRAFQLLTTVESRTGAPAVGFGGGSVAFASGLSPAPLVAFPVRAHRTVRADFRTRLSDEIMPSHTEG